MRSIVSTAPGTDPASVSVPPASVCPPITE
jgi:hypothetical protein